MSATKQRNSGAWVASHPTALRHDVPATARFVGVRGEGFVGLEVFVAFDREPKRTADAAQFGARLTASQVSSAMVRHGQILEKLRAFQDNYSFIVSAANQVPPFDASVHWPTEIEEIPMEHYIAWMRSAYWITTTFHPAISVPAGFTSEGLPVGIQIVGRYRDDLGVLRLANAFEQLTGVGKRRPSAPA